MRWLVQSTMRRAQVPLFFLLPSVARIDILNRKWSKGKRKGNWVTWNWNIVYAFLCTVACLYSFARRSWSIGAWFKSVQMELLQLFLFLRYWNNFTRRSSQLKKFSYTLFSKNSRTETVDGPFDNSAKNCASFFCCLYRNLLSSGLFLLIIMFWFVVFLGTGW